MKKITFLYFITLLLPLSIHCMRRTIFTATNQLIKLFPSHINGYSNQQLVQAIVAHSGPFGKVAKALERHNEPAIQAALLHSRKQTFDNPTPYNLARHHCLQQLVYMHKNPPIG